MQQETHYNSKVGKFFGKHKYSIFLVSEISRHLQAPPKAALPPNISGLPLFVLVLGSPQQSLLGLLAPYEAAADYNSQRAPRGAGEWAGRGTAARASCQAGIGRRRAEVVRD